jgi:hypothetical protein
MERFMSGFIATTDNGSMFVQDIVNTVCFHLAERCVISLCMENGSAYVELTRNGRSVPLPDSTDKTLEQQINDALCVANGFDA